MAREKEKKDKTKKKGRKRYYFGGAVLLVTIVVWYGMQPMRGTIHVGICRTFAELKVPYSHTMRVSLAETFERSQRIYYTYTDGFGQQKSDLIDCRFVHDFTVPNYTIEKISINYVPVPDEEVDRFNKSIPGILAANPDLVIPFPPGDDLKRLKAPE